MSQRPESKAVRIQTPQSSEKEHSTPLFLTSSFTYNSAEEMAAAFADDSLDVNIYSRFSNPTVDEFITKIAALEGTEDGVAFRKVAVPDFQGIQAGWGDDYGAGNTSDVTCT